jgi:hypothetical protein
MNIIRGRSASYRGEQYLIFGNEKDGGWIALNRRNFGEPSIQIENQITPVGVIQHSASAQEVHRS